MESLRQCSCEVMTLCSGYPATLSCEAFSSRLVRSASDPCLYRGPGLRFQLVAHSILISLAWLIFCLLLYPLLGWLFGSYTDPPLATSRLSPCFQRLLITAYGHLWVVAIARWLFNPGDEVWLVTGGSRLSGLGLYSRLGLC